jgi:hypothetical protein
VNHSLALFEFICGGDGGGEIGSGSSGLVGGVRSGEAPSPFGAPFSAGAMYEDEQPAGWGLKALATPRRLANRFAATTPSATPWATPKLREPVVPSCILM